MRPHRFIVYEARDGWRWRLKASNGKIVADSGEAYASKRNADRAVESVRWGAITARVYREGQR